MHIKPHLCQEVARCAAAGFPPKNEQDVRNVSAEGSFVQCLVVFSIVVFICSLFIPLLFTRFNVVVVNSHNDIDIWTISSTTRATRPSDKISKTHS